jgi:hypothetical protein
MSILQEEISRKLKNFKAKQEETRKKKNNKRLSHTSFHAKKAI